MGVNCILIANGHQVKDKLSGNSKIVLDNLRELNKFLNL